MAARRGSVGPGRGSAWIRTVGVLLLTVVVGVWAGCQKTDPIASLKERASSYWGLKQSKGWEEVYDQYLDPEAKKKVSKEAFLKRRWLAFDILSYEISDIQEANDKATVVVVNDANIPLKTPEGELKFFKKQVTTKDEWVRRDGNWYVVLGE
jgi:hypothetical protein